MNKKNLIISLLLLVAFNWTNGQGFTTNNSNGNLLDANGNNFIAKGINIPLAWYINDVNNSIDDIKNNTNANCLRIVIQTSTPDWAWQTAVNNCIANKIIPIVELHDVTGNTTESELVRMGEWWATKASFLTGTDVSKYILINLANEWGDWFTARDNGITWKNASINAIQKMRTAGIKTTIIVDAVGYGQDIDDAKNIRTYAKDIQSADAGFLGTQANLLFSIHMYCQWKTGGDNIDILGTIKSAGIPVMVGEFGYQHADGASTCDIDEQAIMNKCQSYGVGWLAWSQKGNGNGVEYLDLCYNWECTSLSTWGNTVVNGNNGTKTATECTSFNTTLPPTSLGTNIALNKAVTASSTEAGGILIASNITDGNTNSRWASVPNVDNQTLVIDLQSNYSIHDITLRWEAAYATNYSIEISNNNSNWTTTFSNSNGDGGVDLIGNITSSGRYLRISLISRYGATWGFSLFEVEVYGSVSTSTNDILEETSLTLFPNPAKNEITISGTTDGWKIINPSGITVLEGRCTNIDLSNIAAGYYILISGNRHVKFIKLNE